MSDPYTHLYCTQDPWDLEEARKARNDGRATTLGGTYGRVIGIEVKGAGPDQYAEILLRPTPAEGSKLVIPGRYLLEVEYPIVQQDRIEWETWNGDRGYVPGIKRLTPLKITVWAPGGGAVDTPVIVGSNEIQERAFNLLMGSETFELILTPGTINEVRYPKVILTLVAPTITAEGPATKMEFNILAIPSTATTLTTKEPNVRIYEAVIVKLDEKGEPAEVVKVVAPFVAKSDRAAQDQVLIDYAQEAHLAGKDLAGYSVRVRTFQTTV